MHGGRAGRPIGARIGWAVGFALVGLALAIGLRVERAVGVGAGRLTAEVTVPADVEATVDELRAIWTARLGPVEVAAQGGAGGARVLSVALAPGDRSAAYVLGALTVPGELRVQAVLADHPVLSAWCHQLGVRHELPTSSEGCEADRWIDDRGDARFGLYLRGPSPAAIVDRVNALTDAPALPDELELGYEEIPASAEPAYVRAYLLERAPILTRADVAAARVEVMPDTGRPVVQVALTGEGAQAFGSATAAHVGDKLAISIDGWVQSAPVVMGAIRGGRVSITVGGAGGREQYAQAEGLAAALASPGGALPYGLEANLTSVARPASGRWLARGLFALLVGLAALAVIWFVRTPLSTTRWMTPGGPRRWSSLAVASAVTVAAIAALWWIEGNVPLAGLGPDAIDQLGLGDSRPLGVLALGLAPYLAAVFVVELAALVIPRWRAVRLGTPPQRVAIDRAIAVATVLLAAIQGHAMAVFLDGIGRDGVSVLAPGLAAHLALVGSAVGGALVVLLVARVITRFGLGHGVVVIQAALAARVIYRTWPDDAHDPRAAVLALALAIAVVAAVVARLRVGRGARLPWGGVVPAVIVYAAIALVGLASLAWTDAARALAWMYRRQLWLELAILAVVVGELAWRRRGAPRLGLALSVGFLAIVIAAPALVADAARPWLRTLQPALIAAVAIELVVAVRVRLRLGAPVAVLVTHDVDAADAACDRLTEAGVACAAVNLHLRALYRFLAAYAPISVVVAADDRARAEAALSER